MGLAIPADAVRMSHAASKVILIVDDDLPSLETLMTVLQERGVQTQTAVSVREGIEKLSPDHPTCLLLDLVLPDGTGVDVMRYIRDNKIPAHVIVITATADEALIDAVRALQPAAVLRKPYSRRQLMALLDAA